jgi:hypothetical protein
MTKEQHIRKNSEALNQIKIEQIIDKSETQSIKEDVKAYGKKKFITDVIQYIENNYSERMQFIYLKQVLYSMQK